MRLGTQGKGPWEKERKCKYLAGDAYYNFSYITWELALGKKTTKELRRKKCCKEVPEEKSSLLTNSSLPNIINVAD